MHDLDIKDDRYGRAATGGVAQLVAGLTRGYPDDAERLQRALAFFDDLYASFASPRPKARKKKTR